MAVDAYPDIAVTPASTSYFSATRDDLDPHLFDGTHLLPHIREEILRMLFHYLGLHYEMPHAWTNVWLAGSGVSFQWDAARYPGDLDCLVGIDYPEFRNHNRDYAGLSDEEISKQINEGFNTDLMPHTANWRGYELTFYVNPDSWDITAINPYAAYDVVHDRWTVEPSHYGAPHTREWEAAAERDHVRAQEITRRYTDALEGLRNASNPAYRVNAETRLKAAVQQGADLYDEIHAGRKVAFSRVGAGYLDWNNYRWQAGKASGVIQGMKLLKDYQDSVNKSAQAQTYGLELPDTSTLIRRAAAQRVSRS